jgi:hypothetical protein|tara:strand:- start:610 stop:1044 length:435 start_codon:yes stop_codon:yes gene_type:complete
MKHLIHILFLVLVTSCLNNGQTNQIVSEDNLDTLISVQDDSIDYDVIPLFYLTKDDKFKKIYDTLSSLSIVQVVLQDSMKYFDTIALWAYNGQHINDSMYRLPKDCVKVTLEGDYLDSDFFKSFYDFVYVMKTDEIIIKDWAKK